MFRVGNVLLKNSRLCHSRHGWKCPDMSLKWPVFVVCCSSCCQLIDRHLYVIHHSPAPPPPEGKLCSYKCYLDYVSLEVLKWFVWNIQMWHIYSLQKCQYFIQHRLNVTISTVCFTNKWIITIRNIHFLVNCKYFVTGHKSVQDPIK